MTFEELKKRVELFAGRGISKFHTFRALSHLFRGLSKGQHEDLQVAFYAAEKKFYEQQKAKEAAGERKA